MRKNNFKKCSNAGEQSGIKMMYGYLTVRLSSVLQFDALLKHNILRRRDFHIQNIILLHLDV